ncbi:GlsB/YeaQ/YmgE family stress response membrane protein [Actinomycetospora lemnae]|uniref:GlsB/YeaQ/YmgE family stress response membrane protein n=1 Tax=Actinomycetospora lemnae TaxID=3019891 RepID=A0ABT5SUT1_9PSEU|nr:GlsB/YeaQ/YmgE family stress response membrane protein [Actinomycetospora sp. DW7H6]MDD7965911.1 GlsB/YeaQ/YmgE family stress response membrane protein [Actinomycetospora sp. DW7H6]
MTILTILGWIVFGLIVGFIARALVPGKDNIGIFATIGIGILGSVVGGLVFSLFTGRITLSNPVGWIGSVIFAIILLVIYNRVTGRKATRR